MFCPEQSTVQTSMNTHGVQTCHTTASHLIDHTCTYTGPSSTSTRAGGSAPPHTLSGSANDPALVTLLTVPGAITFTLVYTLRGATGSRRGNVSMTESNLYQSPTKHLQYHEGTGMLVTNMLFFVLSFAYSIMYSYSLCAIASGNNKLIQVISQSIMF